MEFNFSKENLLDNRRKEHWIMFFIVMLIFAVALIAMNISGVTFVLGLGAVWILYDPLLELILTGSLRE